MLAKRFYFQCQWHVFMVTPPVIKTKNIIESMSLLNIFRTNCKWSPIFHLLKQTCNYQAVILLIKLQSQLQPGRARYNTRAICAISILAELALVATNEVIRNKSPAAELRLFSVNSKYELLKQKF